MNTKPNDEQLALWVEDELDPATAAKIDSWAAGNPEWLQRRDEARWSRQTLSQALPPAEDVPYGEFFNARIRREIEQAEGASAPAVALRSRRGWIWALPATAAAGLAFGFFLGHGQDDRLPKSVAAEWAPVLYTPEQGVEAELVGGEDATVIVLAGVEAIPDEWEVPATAMLPPEPRQIAKRRDPSNEAAR